MKLCQRCVDAIEEATGLDSEHTEFNDAKTGELYKGDNFLFEPEYGEQARSGLHYDIVPEPECEFWAHAEARRISEDAQKAVTEIAMRTWGPK